MAVYQVYQVDSFTRQRLAGNPAGVVLDAAGLHEEDMQRVARELNNSETAFVLPGKKGEYDVQVRFFTPTCEVPLCGHATIAAHYVRAKMLRLPRCTVVQKTGAGNLPVELVPDGDDYRVIMTQGQVAFGDVLTGDTLEALAGALGMTTAELLPGYPVQIVSTGNGKVLIPLREDGTLRRMQPDMRALTELSGRIGCNGYFPFVFEPQGAEWFTRGRMFAPAGGVNEDPVTGNACSPLGAWLVANGFFGEQSGTFRFRAGQGVEMGRPGSMEVSVEVENGAPVLVKITGEAVIVFETSLEL